jgi:2-oxoacid:acceptor oxidoreductase delta subunit (pyruvate/2-ketoisovalerate family)
MISDSETKPLLPVFQPVPQKPPARMRIIKPRIDLKKCQKNFNCLVLCPHNAISVGKNGFPVIDYNLCTGCLICLRECPVSAINEEHEYKEAKV